MTNDRVSEQIVTNCEGFLFSFFVCFAGRFGWFRSFPLFGSFRSLGLSVLVSVWFLVSRLAAVCLGSSGFAFAAFSASVASASVAALVA